MSRDLMSFPSDDVFAAARALKGERAKYTQLPSHVPPMAPRERRR